MKSEFIKFQDDFLNTFRSLSLIPEIFSPLSLEKRAPFDKLWISSHENQDGEWKELQQATAACPEMGAYWQFLVLKEGHSKIFKKEKVEINTDSKP